MDTKQFKVINKVESLDSAGAVQYTLTLHIVDATAFGTFTVTTNDVAANALYTVGSLYNATIAPAT